MLFVRAYCYHYCDWIFWRQYTLRIRLFIPRYFRNIYNSWTQTTQKLRIIIYGSHKELVYRYGIRTKLWDPWLVTTFHYHILSMVQSIGKINGQSLVFEILCQILTRICYVALKIRPRKFIGLTLMHSNFESR